MSSINDLEGLLHGLANPTDQAAYARNDQLLQSSLSEPGMFHRLQLVAANRSLPQQVRYLASLIMAREAPKKWRAKAIVPDHLKPAIRQTFWTFFEEEDTQIARSQLKLLVAIGRIEYPRIWPTLLDELSTPLQSSFQALSSYPSDLTPVSNPSLYAQRTHQKTILLNSLWTWNAFVKEWRSVKIPAGQQLMGLLVNEFRGMMLGVLERLMARDPVLEDWELLEGARYAFKTCARLVDWEFSRSRAKRAEGDNNEITQTVSLSLSHLARLQTIRLQLLSSPYYTAGGTPTPDSAKTLRSLTKFIRHIGKWYEELMHMDPKAFVTVPGTVEAIGWWWNEVTTAIRQGETPKEDDETTRYPKRFMLQGLILFKNVLPSLSINHKNIFTDDFITSAFHLLVDSLLPFNAEDLEQWEADPEDWLMTQVDNTQTWSYDFRPCAERVLMSLNTAARDRVVLPPLLMTKLQEVMSTQPTDMPSRIKQDAVLCAVGRMSRVMSDHIKLEQLLPAFMPIVGSKNPEDKILKARYAWLISQWVEVDDSAAQLPVVWEVLLHLLSSRGDEVDLAVNISAAMSIKVCTDLWELDIAYFEPYLGRIVEEYLKLISEAESLTGKRHILDGLSVIIERVGDKILPYLPIIGAAIPVLWQGASDLDGEWLFKACLVTMTSKLVTAIAGGATGILPLVTPLIKESLSSPAKDHFEEDGLALWQSTLRAISTLESTSPDGDLIAIFPGLVEKLGSDLDSLGSCLALMDSYMLLAGPQLVQAYGAQIFDAFHKAYTSAGKDKTVHVLESLCYVIRCSPASAWAPHIASCGLMSKICTTLDDHNASGIVLSQLLIICCRMVLSDAETFVQLVKHVGTQSQWGPDKMLETTLDAMYRAGDYVTESSDKKLAAMMWAALVELGEHEIYERLGSEISNVWMDVLGDLGEMRDDGSEGPETMRLWKDDNAGKWSELMFSQELERLELLTSNDPVYTRLLAPYVAEKLQIAHQKGMGPYWEKLGADVKRQLEHLLVPRGGHQAAVQQNAWVN